MNKEEKILKMRKELHELMLSLNKKGFQAFVVLQSNEDKDLNTGGFIGDALDLGRSISSAMASHPPIEAVLKYAVHGHESARKTLSLVREMAQVINELAKDASDEMNWQGSPGNSHGIQFVVDDSKN